MTELAAPPDDVYRTRHLVDLVDTVTPGQWASLSAIPVDAVLGDLPAPEEDADAD
jgi:hypothetical protein